MKKRWAVKDEKTLIDNYATKTIKELMELLPGRSQEGINNKVKRLKAIGKIVGGKDLVTKDRAYRQRKNR